MIALLDLDSFVYQCGFAGQTKDRSVLLKATGETVAQLAKGERIKAWCKKNDISQDDIDIIEDIKVDDLDNILATAESMMGETLMYTKAERWELYLTGKDNFREKLYPDYKRNRGGMTKPVYFQAIRDHYIKHQGAVVIDGMEADDMVTIRSQELQAEGKEVVICSIDKDLKTVEGNYFNPKHPENGVVKISQLEADRFFYSQLLMGDSADNIPGIKGLGPKTAEKLLADCGCAEGMYKVCKRTYIEHYKGEDNYDNRSYAKDLMHLNAQLLYMKRTRDDVWQTPQ